MQLRDSRKLQIGTPRRDRCDIPSSSSRDRGVDRPAVRPSGAVVGVTEGADLRINRAPLLKRRHSAAAKRRAEHIRRTYDGVLPGIRRARCDNAVRYPDLTAIRRGAPSHAPFNWPPHRVGCRPSFLIIKLAGKLDNYIFFFLFPGSIRDLSINIHRNFLTIPHGNSPFYTLLTPLEKEANPPVSGIQPFYRLYEGS